MSVALVLVLGAGVGLIGQIRVNKELEVSRGIQQETDQKLRESLLAYEEDLTGQTLMAAMYGR